VSDFEEDLDFDLRAAKDKEPDEALVLDLDGYEGPLHVLLEMSRSQKVDLRQISILQLAEQYLNFIAHARVLRIELAADYLVMAAWLAWLKSRLILPKPETAEDEEGDPEAAAKALAFRLQRLEAMRNAVDTLFRNDQLGVDVFARGNPEGLRRKTTPIWQAALYDILKAYGARRSIVAKSTVRFETPPVMALEDARDRLTRRLPEADDWRTLDSLLPPESALGAKPPPKKSISASGFAASLELVKEGVAELRQSDVFAPLWLRRSQPRDTAKDDHA